MEVKPVKESLIQLFYNDMRFCTALCLDTGGGVLRPGTASPSEPQSQSKPPKDPEHQAAIEGETPVCETQKWSAKNAGKSRGK